MDDTSESGSVLPWLWVTEALAGFKEINSSTLQDLIEAAPVKPENFGKNTRELVALRCLEGLFGSANTISSDDSSVCDSRIEFEFSQSCEDVLRQILHKIPLSNLRMAGAELLKWDVLPFIMHKRASAIKCDLKQMEKSILEGACPYPDCVEERSGLASRNQGYPIPVNNGKCNDVLRKDNGNSNNAAVPDSSTMMPQHLEEPANAHFTRPQDSKRQDTPEASDLFKRRRILWTAEEEEMLMEGMQKFGDAKNPWKLILEFGSHVFSEDRKAESLKDKWKNMRKGSSKSK